MTTSPFSLRDTARELNMLTFVEQDLARQQQAGQIDEAFLKVLRERLNQRQHHLYNSMIEYAERAEQWHVLRALSRAHARRNPGDAQLHERAGIAALRLGRNQEALVALERAVRLGSRKFNVLYELGQLYDASGRPTEATLAWEMAIACAPNATRRIQLIEHLTRRTAAEREVAQTTVPGSVRPQLAATPARITYLRGFLAEVARAVGRLDWLPRAAEPTRSVTPAQPQPIPASEPTAPPSKPTVARQPQRTFDWAEFWSALFSERMLHALLYLGATLLVISAFIWMAFNWNRFAAPVQLAALGGITSIFYGCGWVVRSKLGLLRSGSTLIAIGAGWVAVIGWALANLLGLSPPQTWLLISAVCLPAYLATTLWLREEIFSALSAIASVNLLLAALQLVNLGQAAQGCALVVLMIGFVALVPTLRSLRDGQRLAGPPVWIAQALVPLALLYAVLALRGDWLTGPFDRHLLVGIWWLGAGHYLFSLRRLSGIAYEQALAWVAPTALLLSADIAGVPAAWHGVVLLATTPIYLLVGPTRARAYAGLRRPWMRYQIAWPVYSTPYVLALLALTWPGVGPLIQLVTSLGVTALCAVSTRIFRQPLWVWMACGAGLLAGWDLALLLAPLSLTIQVIGLAGFGVLYWLVGASLERAPRYARAPLTIGYILLSLALVMAFWLAPDARPATFALVIAVSAASATLLRANRLAAICDVPLSSTVLEPSFVALAAALLPGWLAVLVPQLPGRTFDLILVSLAATYLLGVPMLGPREPAERRATFDGLLTALAVMLSGLAVAGVGRAEPLLSFGWLLAAAVFGCYLVTHPPTKQQDLPALLGGLMVLWLTMLPTARGPLQALPVIGGVAGLYVFGAGLQRRVGWLYLLGGLLCGGWLLGLHLLRVPLAEQLAWLAPAALLAVAGGLFAEQRRWPHAAVPGYLYGYALATTSVVGSLVLFTGGQLASALPQAALAMAALALLSMILALRFRAAPFIGLTGMLPVLAYLLTLSATHVPLGRYGLAAAGLSTLYLALATFPAQLASAAAQSQGMARRLADGLRLFDATLRRGFYLLSLAALLGGGLAALTSGLRPLAPICLLLAGAYGLGAYWLRRPGMVAVAAPLAAAGATALFAGYVEPLVPTAARGVLWVLLAWAFVGLARRLPSTPQAYRRPIFATGFTLASLACGWTLFDRPLLLITMGSLLLLCLRWDHTLSSAHSAPPWGNQLLARIVNMPPFLTVVALLTPIWLWLLLDTLALNRPAVAFGLALLAAAWLGVAQLVRQRPGADLPFLAACYTLVILTPIMAAEVIGWTLAIIVGLYVGIGYLASRLATAPTARFVFLVIISPLMFVLAIGALVSVGFATPSLYLTGVCGLATSIFVGSARFQRRPLWMVAAAAATPITAISGLAVIHPVESLYVILLLALGMANLGLSWLLERRGVARDYTQPLDAAAALCGLLALGLALLLPLPLLHLPIVVVSPLPDLLRLLLLTGTLLLFALGALRQRDPLWLYGSAAALVPAYVLTLDLIGVHPAWAGVACLPGAFGAFGLGQLLERRDWPKVSSWRPRLISPANGFAWGLPAYLLALLASLTAIALAAGMNWSLALALAGATALSAWAAWAWGRQRWQWLALALGHLAYLVTVSAIAPEPNPRMLPLVILGALLTCLAGGLQAEGPRALAAVSAAQRLNTHSWAQSYYAFAVLDAGLAVLLSLSPQGVPISAMVVGGVLTLLAGALAAIWRDGQLAMVAPIMLALAIDGLLRQVGFDTSLRLMLLAAEGIGAWWLAEGLLWRASQRDEASPGIWPVPLQRWGHLANLGALAWAIELTIDGAGLTPLSCGLALAGLFYVGVALRRRQLRLSYLGSGMLVVAWMLTVLTAMPSQIQAYAIPAGVYLLAIGAAERWQGSPRRLCHVLELLGMALLLGVSLWQSLPASFGYGALLGAEALLIIVWGALQRVRLLFFGGIVVFLTNVAMQSVGPIQAADKALLAFAVGLVLVAVAVFVERRREHLRESARRLWTQLETWS